MNWYIKVLKQYADFNGRARRQEYWMFFLFNIIAAFALVMVGGAIGGALDAPAIAMIPYMIYILGVFIPGLAVSVRRLHDQNKSGWYYLVAFIPLIGGIWLLVLLATEGDSGPNQYGADPKSPATELNDIGVVEV